MIFLLSLPIVLQLTKSASFERTEQLIKHSLSGIIFGSLVTWVVALVVYKDLSGIADRTVIFGGLSPSVLSRSAVLIFYSSLIFIWRDRKFLYVIFLIMSVFFLLLTESKGAIVGLVLSFLILLFVYKKQLFLFVSPIVVLLVIINSGLIINVYNDPQGMFNTFSSRIVLWNYIISDILQSRFDLFFGIGYGASQEMQTFSLWGDTDIAQAHNFIIESLMSVGIIGTAVLITFMYSLFSLYLTVFNTNEWGIRSSASYPDLLYIHVWIGVVVFE